jgi:hypothetical protein
MRVLVLTSEVFLVKLMLKAREIDSSDQDLLEILENDIMNQLSSTSAVADALKAIHALAERRASHG